MEKLSFDNIFGEDEIDTLFTLPDESSEETEETVEPDQESTEEIDKKDSTTEAVNPEDLFQNDHQPESVGSGDDKKEGEKEDAVPDNDGGTSPNNFYSSIASALAVDGIFPNLDDEVISKATDAESFSDLIDAEVNARLDERQRRISDALKNGVEPTDIKRYENTLNYISSITDASLQEESEKGEQLRRNLIYQDFLNKGYTPEKAQKFTERTIDAGTDVEDAKEALQSNREYFQNAYNSLLKDAQKAADKEKEERRRQSDKLRDSLINDKQLLGDIELGQDIRKKMFENISKPIYKDPETGDYLTALQKYELEHHADFLKYVGAIFTLTNGFKDFESFTKGKVKKEVRKGLREFEKSLTSSSRASGGNMRLVTNVSDDPESFIGKGMRLDI